MTDLHIVPSPPEDSTNAPRSLDASIMPLSNLDPSAGIGMAMQYLENKEKDPFTDRRMVAGSRNESVEPSVPMTTPRPSLTLITGDAMENAHHEQSQTKGAEVPVDSPESIGVVGDGGQSFFTQTEAGTDIDQSAFGELTDPNQNSQKG